MTTVICGEKNNLEAYKWSEIIKNFDSKNAKNVVIEKNYEIIGYNIPDGCVFSFPVNGWDFIRVFAKNIRIENVTLDLIKIYVDTYNKTTPEEFAAIQKRIDAGRAICETEEKKDRDTIEAEQKKHCELLISAITEVFRKNPEFLTEIFRKNPEFLTEIFRKNPEFLTEIFRKNPELLTDAVIDKVEDLVDGRVVELLKFISEMHRDNQQKKV